MVDEQTNRLNLAGIIDELHVGGVDRTTVEAGVAFNANLLFVTLWWRSQREEPEDLQMRIVFVDPTGTAYGQTDGRDVDLRNYIVARTIWKLEQMVVKGYGEHTIRIESRARDSDPWSLVPQGDVVFFIGEAPPGDAPDPRANIA
ncbi:MAG TPA: hypothetical protein VIJ22_16130 [Polyangiaceae bacterium]